MIPQQRKKWLSLDSRFGRVSVLTAITLMQEKFCFGRFSVSVFVRFAFARLGSAPVGSVRAKNQADYMYKKIRHGRVLKCSLYRGAISKACWNYLNVYGQGDGREEGRASPPFPAITSSTVEVKVVPERFRDCASV